MMVNLHQEKAMYGVQICSFVVEDPPVSFKPVKPKESFNKAVPNDLFLLSERVTSEEHLKEDKWIIGKDHVVIEGPRNLDQKVWAYSQVTKRCLIVLLFL